VIKIRNVSRMTLILPECLVQPGEIADVPETELVKKQLAAKAIVEVKEEQKSE